MTEPADAAALLLDVIANADGIRQVADLLGAHPDYRILRRFKGRDVYADATNARALKKGIFVDVETTGLDPETDEIIQFCAVPFLFDNEPTGAERILQVLPGLAYLEQPTTPIPDDVVELTGITNDQVRGERIDSDAVRAMVDQPDVALIVAHFADFDRRRIERRFPDSAFARLPWACSSKEIAWARRYGAVAAKLGAALAAFGEFTDNAHNALEDCLVGIHVLASSKTCETCNGDGAIALQAEGFGEPADPCPDCVEGQRRPFVDLLHSARRPDYRIHAYSSPFEVKDRLAARKYKWQPEKPGVTKNWYRDVKAADVEGERAWLLEACGPSVDIRFNKIGARDRYSARV